MWLFIVIALSVTPVTVLATNECNVMGVGYCLLVLRHTSPTQAAILANLSLLQVFCEESDKFETCVKPLRQHCPAGTLPKNMTIYFGKIKGGRAFGCGDVKFTGAEWDPACPNQRLMGCLGTSSKDIPSVEAQAKDLRGTWDKVCSIMDAAEECLMPMLSKCKYLKQVQSEMRPEVRTYTHPMIDCKSSKPTDVTTPATGTRTKSPDSNGRKEKPNAGAGCSW